MEIQGTSQPPGVPSLTMRPSAHATAAGTGSMRFPWLERLIFFGLWTTCDMRSVLGGSGRRALCAFVGRVWGNTWVEVRLGNGSSPLRHLAASQDVKF